MEATELGLFMVVACTTSVLLEFPGSPVRQAVPQDWVRRVIAGVTMGVTAIAIIYSPWGKRSGAHFNPAVTLTFYRLGKVNGADATFYVAAQFFGSVGGVMLAAAVLQKSLTDPPVSSAVTLPGAHGALVAFGAEALIALVQMTVILNVSNRPAISRHTGLVAGALVAFYISVEGPLSGMSMNPARTFGSALSAGIWSSVWIYFIAPPLGMLLAAELFLWLKGPDGVSCAKLHHHNRERCIFNCSFEVRGHTGNAASIKAVS